MPISSRKLRASILTVGCSETNLLSGPEAKSITPTAITTAAIITSMSSAMPTAVITESSEKTMSSSRIWMMTAANDDGLAAGRAVLLLALELFVDLGRRFVDQEEPAAEQDQVAPGEVVAGDRERADRSGWRSS